MTTNKPIHLTTIQNDFHRPHYHYVPQSNWMNDPNGVIHWNGRYHLFYQYNPYGADHANMHWGHAVSDNLTHWEELPIALTPTPNTADRGGIFSGCIVDDNGIPKAFYTGVNEAYDVQTQFLAIGSNDLVTWEKSADNPIIPLLPNEVGQTNDFRDPFVWQADDGWYMAVGSRIDGVGGAILLYRSDDLTNWTYLNPLWVGESARHGYMAECPNFFKLGDKWVLIISAHLVLDTGTVLYYVGDFKDNRFIPESDGVLDSGYYYAPLTHLDDKGRRIMWAWVREGRDQDHFVNAGWAGIQAFPRVLSLDSQNRLCMTPAEEITTLHTNHQHYTAETATSPLAQSSLSLDIQATFNIEQANRYGLDIICSTDGSERITIYYDRLTETVRIERKYDDGNTGHDTYTQGLIHTLDADETLDLRILLDGSIIEVIANQRTSITSRFYPTRADETQLAVINSTSLLSLDVWNMESIW